MVPINLTLNLDFPISDEELSIKMSILGELVVNRIKQNIREMKLISEVSGGALLQGWFSKYENGQLVIENTQDYMVYLEFGTYSYWDNFGTSSYPDPSPPKKKDIPAELRKMYPKGMQPFAFIRRVLYNPQIMQELVNEAFS